MIPTDAVACTNNTARRMSGAGAASRGGRGLYAGFPATAHDLNKAEPTTSRTSQSTVNLVITL